MPEGDSIFRAARTLNSALAGRAVTRFESMLPTLDRVDHDFPVAGRQVIGVSSRGKWMVMEFSGDLFLLTHTLMSGSWHVYKPGERWQRPRRQMRIVLETDAYVAVAFNVPVAEFHTAATLARREGFAELGPDLLSPEFDIQMAAGNLRSRPELEVGEALLRQSVIAGAGNIFKSEICFVAGVNPFRTAGSLDDAELQRLLQTARRLLMQNITASSGSGITTRRTLRSTSAQSGRREGLYVYGRAGQPCRNCGTAIMMRKQGDGARVTFWCPVCQPA